MCLGLDDHSIKVAKRVLQHTGKYLRWDESSLVTLRIPWASLDFGLAIQKQNAASTPSYPRWHHRPARRASPGHRRPFDNEAVEERGYAHNAAGWHAAHLDRGTGTLNHSARLVARVGHDE
jgi:hypothetical protein